MSQRCRGVISLFIIISILFQASELQLVVYAYSLDDLQALAPRSSFNQKYFPVSGPDKIIPRTNLKYGEFLQGLEFLEGKSTSRNKSWYWNNVLNLMERAGVISKGASEKLREGIGKGEKNIFRILRLLIIHVRTQEAYSGMRDMPNGLRHILQKMDLQIEPIEGYPLLLLREENIGYRGKILAVEDLLPERTLKVRSHLSSRGGQRPTWRSHEIASATPPADKSPMARNDETVVSSPSLGLILYQPGMIAIQIRQGGFLERRNAARPIHNEKEWAQRFHELGTGSREDMDEAIELLNVSQIDKTLYRILEEEGLGWPILLAPLFEYMNPQEVARLFIQIAKGEAQSSHYKDCIFWFCEILGHIDPDKSVAILEAMLFDPALATRLSIALAERILTTDYQEVRLGNMVYVWETLHERHPAQIAHWKEYYNEKGLAQTEFFKTYSPALQALSDFRRSIAHDQSTAGIRYAKLKEELTRVLETMAASGPGSVSERLKQKLSNIILLGQNGNTAYEEILKPQSYAELIPELFKYQSPEVMAIFLTEVASVEEESNDRLIWLLKLLLKEEILGKDHIYQVVHQMLFNESFRKAGSHKALQQIFARGTFDPDLLGSALDIAFPITEEAQASIYNSPETIVSTGIFLVRDLKGDLRKEAMLRASARLTEIKKDLQDRRGGLSSAAVSLGKAAMATAKRLLRDESSGLSLGALGPGHPQVRALRGGEGVGLEGRTFALEDFRQAYIENILSAIKILGGAKVGVKQEGKPIDSYEVEVLDIVGALVWGHENRRIKAVARKVLEAADAEIVEEMLIRQVEKIDVKNVDERSEVLKILVPVSIRSKNISKTVMHYWNSFAPARGEWKSLSKKLTPLERKRALLLFYEWRVKTMRFQRGLADEIEKGMAGYKDLGIDESLPLFVIHDLREQPLDMERIRNIIRKLEDYPGFEAGELYRKAEVWIKAKKHERKEIFEVVQEVSRLQKEVFGAVDVPFSLEITLIYARASLRQDIDLIHVLVEHHHELGELQKLFFKPPQEALEQRHFLIFNAVLLSIVSLLEAGCKSEEMNLKYIAAALHASGGRLVEFHKNLKVLERLEIKMIHVTRKITVSSPFNDSLRASIIGLAERLKQYPRLFRRAVAFVIQFTEKESVSVDDLYSPSTILIPILDMLKTYLGYQEPHPSIAPLVYALDPNRRIYEALVLKTLRLLNIMIKDRTPIMNVFIHVGLPRIIEALKRSPHLLLEVLDVLIQVAKKGIPPASVILQFYGKGELIARDFEGFSTRAKVFIEQAA